MNATPIIIGTILVFILVYQYCYGFVMARLSIFKDNMTTPATRMYDGSNYYPMSKWVLFGHHFAAIAGAVMAGAMHNQIILLASVKHDGQSLVEVARAEINKTSGITASIDVLIILVVALAGLGMVSQPNKQWGSNINDAPPSNIDYNSGRGY